MYFLLSLSTDDVTFAVNGGSDQPGCGLLLDDRAVSLLLSGSYSATRGDTIQITREMIMDHQTVLSGYTQIFWFWSFVRCVG